MKVAPQTVDWLLQPANPAARAFTLQHVIGRGIEDPELVDARASIMRTPWIRRLLRNQHADGWWVNPKNSYHPRGAGTVWHLHVLAELGVPGDDPRIARACDRVISQNGMPDGGFACGLHRERYSEECFTGHMLHTLLAFGRVSAPRTQHAVDWILDRQLADGGWNCRPRQNHSSFVSTLGAMKALALLPPKRRGTALDRAVDFLLAHRLFFSHTTGRPVPKFWPAGIRVPVHYGYDLLHPLRTLCLAGAAPDPRLDDALDLLEARADPKGRWQVDSTSDVIPIEVPGRPAKWATANALWVLRHFDRLEAVAA